MITLEQAFDNAKRFIAKMKGLDILINKRPLIDILDFTPLKNEETERRYLLFVSFISGLFNPKRESFRIEVNKDTGEIEKIEWISEE